MSVMTRFFQGLSIHLQNHTPFLGKDTSQSYLTLLPAILMERVGRFYNNAGNPTK